MTWPDNVLLLSNNRPRLPFDGALPEEVDLVTQLQATSQALAEHCRAVLVGDGGDWAEAARGLTAAAEACQNMAVLVTETQLLVELLSVKR
jgi:hypothetical protein